jgi:hypothetical protein
MTNLNFFTSYKNGDFSGNGSIRYGNGSLELSVTPRQFWLTSTTE